MQNRKNSLFRSILTNEFPSSFCRFGEKLPSLLHHFFLLFSQKVGLIPLSTNFLLSLYFPNQRDYGWPLLTVETDANGDSKRTNERGPFLVAWFIRLVVSVQEIFVLSWLLQSAPFQNIFSLTVYIQFSFSHRLESWAGSRAGAPVSYYMSLFPNQMFARSQVAFSATFICNQLQIMTFLFKKDRHFSLEEAESVCWDMATKLG